MYLDKTFIRLPVEGITARQRTRTGAVLKILIAGGGTGGHLFPGIAIAEEFLRRGEAKVLFVGAGKKLERDVLGRLGFSLRTIPVEGFKGKGIVRMLDALSRLPRALWMSFRIIWEFRPQIVIGMGGYASGPVVLAAWILGIRTAVAEQNAVPGMTNKILGKIAHRIFLTYEETAKWFAAEKTVVTGNPVRSVFREDRKEGRKERGAFTILIFGGSQGARAINRAILDVLPCLKGMNITFIHQTGADDLEDMIDGYSHYGFKARVQPFIQDMAAAYDEADLVICRAGATSIAEITALGKAAIVVPFPHAVDDHQKRNAQLLAKAGAALLMEEKKLERKELAETIEKFYRHPELLRKMEAKSASLAHAGAAAEIVDLCLNLLGRKITSPEDAKI